MNDSYSSLRSLNMEETANDSLVAPAAQQGKSQRTHSGLQAQPKRNGRNRKNNQQTNGAVSDSMAGEPATSPRSKKAHNKPRQSLAPGVAESQQQNGQMGNNTGARTRPISVGNPTIQSTPAKEQAYAGPTFHASPAASALPVPKFFSKSVPNIAAKPSLQARMEGETTPAGQDSSPESDVVSPVPNREAQQSPLDFFFKADRAEKERSRSGTGPLSPGAVRHSNTTTARASSSQQSGKGVFLQELDGDDTDMPSPRTVPKGGRPGTGDRSTSFPGIAQRQTENDEERKAYTKNLKDLLFQAASTPQNPSPKALSRNNSGSQTPDGLPGSPSPLNRANSGPSTPQPAIEQQQHHYSLHYGNRNLSPMFKATRVDTPPRPSSLRQEVPTGTSTDNGSSRPGSADTNAFARSYLQEQIRSSAPVQMPPLPFQAGAKAGYQTGNASNPATIPGQRAFNQQASSDQAGPTTPRTGSSRDIRIMEDDLRRILKLNV